jgi:hypothetical protein
MAHLPKNIDVNKLRYSELRSLSSGAKTVYVNYGAEKLTIQTPVLSIPYGIGVPFVAKDEAKNNNGMVSAENKYDLTMSFRGMDDNPKIKLFHDKLKEIENKIIDDAFTNRIAWFKDDFDGNKAFVSKLFSPIIKVDKDKETGKLVGKYPPTFKAKLPYDNKTNAFIFDSYDMDNNELNFTSIMNKLKGAKTQLIVQLTGIWFAGGKYGCSWKIITAKFQLHQNSKITWIEDSDTENVVADDDEDDDDVVDSEVLRNLPSAQSKNVNTTVVEDDDEEDEETEEEEVAEEEEAEEEIVEPPPSKPVKKATPPPVAVEDEPSKPVAPVKKPLKKVAATK